MSAPPTITVRTADQVFTSLLGTLAAQGFPAAAWQPGSVPRTLLRASSEALSVLYGIVGDTGAAAFLDYATGAWLTLHAASRFDVTRAAATFAEHSLTLVNASGAGPYTIGPGALVMASSGGVRFRSTNTANVVVPLSGSVTVTLRAEVSGPAGNAAPAVILSPANAGMSSTYGSVTKSGADEESDANLRARCRAKWSTLGRGATLDAYVYLATSCPEAPTVTRAKAATGGGNGTVTVYVAQTSAAATGGQVSTVLAYVTARAPATDGATVVAADVVTVNVSGAVTFESATYNTSDAHAAIEAALEAALGARPIGEDVDLGALYAAIRGATPGVLDVDLNTPSGDTAVGVDEVSEAGTISLTYAP
jgi:uncharacterized phage protein gp47/JayE